MFKFWNRFLHIQIVEFSWCWWESFLFNTRDQNTCDVAGVNVTIFKVSLSFMLIKYTNIQQHLRYFEPKVTCVVLWKIGNNDATTNTNPR